MQFAYFYVAMSPHPTPDGAVEVASGAGRWSPSLEGGGGPGWDSSPPVSTTSDLRNVLPSDHSGLPQRATSGCCCPRHHAGHSRLPREGSQGLSAMLQHLADGPGHLMLVRGNTGAVYPWVGRTSSASLAIENYRCLQPACGARTVGLDSRFRNSFRRSPPSPDARCRASRVRVALSTRAQKSPIIRIYCEGFFATTSSAKKKKKKKKDPPSDVGLTASGSPTMARLPDQGIVGLGGSVHARNFAGRGCRVRPYFDTRRCTGTPVAVVVTKNAVDRGSPQQVIDRTLSFREYVGDYQSALFLFDHSGLRLKTVLEQLYLAARSADGTA